MTKYTYYKKVESSDHLYFAEELYGFFYDIIPKETKPQDLHTIIRRYIKDYELVVEPLYYKTSNGLKRVYDVNMALMAIEYHVSNLAAKKKGGIA